VSDKRQAGVSGAPSPPPALPSGAGGDEKGEELGVRGVEVVNAGLALRGRHRAIDAGVVPALKVEARQNSFSKDTLGLGFRV
jgi:hypothetical protein